MNKKISVILLLALVITIGGVYATWGYAQGEIGNAIASLDVGEGKNIYITGASSDSTAGVIGIDTSAVKIAIDDSNNDHVADLTYEGDIVITFTPSEGADSNIVTNGVELNLTGTCTADWKYNEKAIFSLSPGFAKTYSGAAMVDGKQTYTIPASEWQTWLIFNEGQSLELDTMAEYESFHDALHLGMISFTVSD